jgi:hypothetical protein
LGLVFEKHRFETRTPLHSLPAQIRRLKMPSPAADPERWGWAPAESAGKSGDDAVGAGSKFSGVWMAYSFVGACCLPFQTQGFNNRSVAVNVFELYIVEQSAASPNQHQQSPA